MKRPLLIVSLAFMLGVILNKEIIWTVIIITVFFLLYKNKYEYKNYTLKLILVVFLSALAGLFYIRIYESIKTGEITEYDGQSAEIKGVVYNANNQAYLLREVEINQKSISSNVQITSGNHVKYGDRIRAYGNIKIPDKARNTGGFDYQKYLKTKNIYLTGKAENIEVIENNQVTIIENISETIREKVREFAQNTLNKEEAGILEALIIGEDSNIEEALQEDYKKAGMIHLLVVSGGHTAFLILLIMYILKFIKTGNNVSKYILISSLIMYMFITGLVPSIVRAGVMAIIVITGELIGRQNDGLTAMGLVALLVVIWNPYIIYSLSFELSFLGAFGIVLAYPKISKMLNFLPKALSEALSLTIAAQLFVTPITLYNFNTIYFGGIISNIFAMGLAGIIMISGIIIFPVYLLIPPLADIIMRIEALLICLMNKIAEVFSNIPFFNYTLTTPYIVQIGIYYAILLYVLDICDKLTGNNENIKKLPIKWLDKAKKKKNAVICGMVSILLLGIIPKIVPKPAEINVIDVGHGDSILITTKHRKAILIDTGDAYVYNEKRYDSGSQTVVPYLLDKGYKSIDLLILSHLDSDHVGGLKSVIDNINVRAIGISINSNYKEEYLDIEEIINNKNIKKIFLEKGQTLGIDGIELQILSPERNEQIDKENNDSIVIMMKTEGIKALLTGDLEAEGEEILLSEYKDLSADILKVGHHGSITSTTKEFVEKVKPRISLISVGKRFSSIPANAVLDRLSSVYSKVYRTDKRGEITIQIAGKRIIVDTAL